MKLKQWQKNIFSVLVIAGGGFVLFNLAFMLTALVVRASMVLLGQSEGAVPNLSGRLLAVFLIFLFSWLVLRSKQSDLVKATTFTLPLMVVLVGAGVALSFYSKWIVIGMGVVIIGGVLFYLKKKGLPWQYYFATGYVAALGLSIMLFNIDI